MKYIYRVIALLILFMFAMQAQAWTHEVSFGYGQSKEVGENYTNSGFFLHGKFYKFKPLDKNLYFTIDGSLGAWRASTKKNKNLETVAVSGAFRAYFTDPTKHLYRPYLLATFGPVYLSQKKFGKEEQGAHYAFQTTLGGGMEFLNKQKRGIDISLRMIHYCNAGLADPNQGFDILYVGSIGYLF